MGTAIRASKEPAVNTFRRSLIGKNGTHFMNEAREIARIVSPSTAMPKKPSTTDGIAEMNSMYGLIRLFSIGEATSLT